MVSRDREGPRRCFRKRRAAPAAVLAVLAVAATGCGTTARQQVTAPATSPQQSASSPGLPTAPASARAPAPVDASTALPTAADLGLGWGSGSDQDHAAEGDLVYLWALTHCVALSALATGSGDLDGPAFDRGFAALAHRTPWVALSNNPNLARTGQYQEQDVIAYAGPAGTYATVTEAMRDCSTPPTPSRTVEVQQAAPPTVPAGVHVAAYRYSLGQLLAEVLVLGDRRQTVVADIEDAPSTTGQQADQHAEAALVRMTALAVASAMTR